MAHEDAKKNLARAVTPSQRAEAVRRALRDGMPLAEIEAFLDYLETTRRQRPNRSDDPK